MSKLRLAKTVILLGLAASRNPTVRAAIRAAPGLVSEERKAAAYQAARIAARNAGYFAGRVLPRNKYF